MTIQQVINSNKHISMNAVKADTALTLEIQNKLCALGLLDPIIVGSVSSEFRPTAQQDGMFGPSTLSMLEYFAKLTNNIVGGILTPALAIALRDAKPGVFLPINTTPLATDSPGSLLAKRLVRFLISKGYWIAHAPDMYNIVYIEGMNPDGTINSDADNLWNDVRALIRINSKGNPELTMAVTATTEPNIEFAKTPIAKARGGVARIAFGQYKAWQMGFHKNKIHHPALVQRSNVRIYRDLNADGLRTNDKIFVGSDFGINQHSTPTASGIPPTVIGRWSEGCLVGQKWAEHVQFLANLQKDIRYIKNPKYMFLSAVLNGDEFVKFN